MPKDIETAWNVIPEIIQEFGDIWDYVGDELRADQHEHEQFFSLWDLVNSPIPEGIWTEFNEETLLIRPEALDIWFALLLLPTEPDGGELWLEIEEETMVLQKPDIQDDIWDDADEQTIVLKKPSTDFWDNIRPSERARYTPIRVPHWALKPQRDSKGERYYILKNIKTNKYIQLSLEQEFLWEQIDDRNSFEDITIAYLIEYGTFDIEGLMAFLTQLGQNGFLENPMVDVYAFSGQAMKAQRTSQRLYARINRLLQFTIEINGIDNLIGHGYRYLGKPIFSRVGRITATILAILGLIIFLGQSIRNLYTPTAIEQGIWGVIGLYVALAVVVFIHEMAHAFTVKHYGREVRRGGMMLYLGFIAFFIDTSDILLSPRKARIEVSWAGPFSGFVLAGLASITSLFVNSDVLQAFFYQVSFSAYVVSLLQLNPLLRYDGYYILMDWLEIPRLRERAISFVRSKLLKKIFRRETFSKEERLYTIFGSLSLAWTLFAVVLALSVWGNRLSAFFLGIF